MYIYCIYTDIIYFVYLIIHLFIIYLLYVYDRGMYKPLYGNANLFVLSYTFLYCTI